MKFNFGCFNDLFFWCFFKTFIGDLVFISALSLTLNFTVRSEAFGVMDIVVPWRKDPRVGGNLAVLGEPKFLRIFSLSGSTKFIYEAGCLALATGDLPMNELNSNSVLIGIVLVRVCWLNKFKFLCFWRWVSGPKGYTFSRLFSFYW